jgi:hypothetical protein
MSPLLMNATLGILRQMPAVASEVESIIKDTESDDAKADKVKEVMQDAIKLLTTISESL